MKNIFYKYLSLILCLCFWSSTSFAQALETGSGEGTVGAKFLSIGIGSRAIALGDAYASIADDATALYWNPAGIATLDKNAVVLNHVNWFADIKHDFIGTVFDISSGSALGVSFTFMTMPDQEVTTVQQPEGTGLMYSASSFALGLTYSRRLTSEFSIGMTGKYIREQIWEASSSNIGFDIGLLYDIGYQDLTIGMSVMNLGPTMRFGGRTLEGELVREDWPLSREPLNVALQSNDYHIPLRMSLGLSKKVGFSPESNAILAISVNNANDLGETYSGGVEYGYKSVALRGGYRTGYNDIGDGAGFSAGAGYKFYMSKRSQMTIDYAYHNYGVLSSVNRFTLQMTF